MNTIRIEFHATDEVIALQRGQLATIARPRGVRLTCTSGILWVTESNKLQDLVLYPGDDLLLARRGLVCIYALHAGTVRVEAPRPAPSLWARFAHVAAGWMQRPTRAAALGGRSMDSRANYWLDALRVLPDPITRDPAPAARSRSSAGSGRPARSLPPRAIT